MQQPVALAATSPVLADGTPLTISAGPTSYTLDAAVAKAGFTFGALVYRNTAGAVEIYDGAANWIPETSFDPSSATLKPTAFAFDQQHNTWSGTMLLSTLPGAADAGFATSGASPKYGFIAIFTTPKSSPTTAIRSALGTPFGVASSNASLPVQPGLLQGLVPTQDPKTADGFAVSVRDASQTLLADLVVSGDSSLSQQVMVRLYSGGVVRASVALENDTSVRVSSGNQITLDAPVVVLTGTLQAQNIEYVPYGGAGERFLT